jgi:hypothetical protein
MNVVEMEEAILLPSEQSRIGVAFRRRGTDVNNICVAGKKAK